jgi:selenocysteine-specific elongation factor
LETLGGGVVLDPWAPRARKKNHAAIARELTELEAGDTSVLLHRAGVNGLDANQAAIRGISDGVVLAEKRLHPVWVERLAEHLKTQLTEWHRTHPLAPGAPRRAVHAGLAAGLSGPAYDALITHLCAQGALAASGPTVRLESFRVELDGAQQDARDRMIGQLKSSGLEGAKFDDLIQQTQGLLQLLLDSGEAERIGERVVGCAHLTKLKADIKAFFARTERLTPSDFKDLTGQSRRTAIPLLEWLDAAGITRRDGDARVAG